MKKPEENYVENLIVLEGPDRELNVKIRADIDISRLFLQMMLGNEELRESIMDAVCAYAANFPDIVKFYSKMCAFTSIIRERNGSIYTPDGQCSFFDTLHTQRNEEAN